MGLEITMVPLSETTFVKKVPPYIQTYLGESVLAPMRQVILSQDEARQCAEAGGRVMMSAQDGCFFPPTDNGGNGNGNGFVIENWMYVAGGVGALGLLWYFTR